GRETAGGGGEPSIPAARGGRGAVAGGAGAGAEGAADGGRFRPRRGAVGRGADIPEQRVCDTMTRTGRREDDMRRCILWLAVATLVGLPALGARGDEEKVPLDKAPRPVLEAVKGRFPDAKVSGVTREKEDGKTVYEVTIKDKG